MATEFISKIKLDLGNGEQEYILKAPGTIVELEPITTQTALGQLIANRNTAENGEARRVTFDFTLNQVKYPAGTMIVCYDHDWHSFTGNYDNRYVNIVASNLDLPAASAALENHVFYSINAHNFQICREGDNGTYTWEDLTTEVTNEFVEQVADQETLDEIDTPEESKLYYVKEDKTFKYWDVTENDWITLNQKSNIRDYVHDLRKVETGVDTGIYDIVYQRHIYDTDTLVLQNNTLGNVQYVYSADCTPGNAANTIYYCQGEIFRLSIPYSQAVTLSVNDGADTITYNLLYPANSLWIVNGYDSVNNTPILDPLVPSTNAEIREAQYEKFGSGTGYPTIDPGVQYHVIDGETEQDLAIAAGDGISIVEDPITHESIITNTGFVYKGQITYANLQNVVANVGWVYTISDTTQYYKAGTKVLRWTDGVTESWEQINYPIKFLEITQADFDLLPQAEKDNGTIYFITDSDDGPETYAEGRGITITEGTIATPALIYCSNVNADINIPNTAKVGDLYKYIKAKISVKAHWKEYYAPGSTWVVSATSPEVTLEALQSPTSIVMPQANYDVLDPEVKTEFKYIPIIIDEN